MSAVVRNKVGRGRLGREKREWQGNGEQRVRWGKGGLLLGL
jgi:hypothetical protein